MAQLLKEPQKEYEQAALKLLMDPKQETEPDDPVVESKPGNFEDHYGQKLEFNRNDALAVLKALSLNCGILGDYLVVMNGKADVTICGEPYLALQLWFNMVSGKFIRRIWSQTVAYGKVVNITQFREVCTNHFGCRPCVGYILGDKEQHSQEFVISQTPLPRRISRECKKVLDKDITEDIQSCQQCLKLVFSSVKMPEKPNDVTSGNESITDDTDVLMKQETLMEDSLEDNYEYKTFDYEVEPQPDAYQAMQKEMEQRMEMDVNEDVFDAQDEKPSSQKDFACESDGCQYVTDRKWVLKRHCERLAHFSSVITQNEKVPSRPKKVKEIQNFVCESEDCNFLTHYLSSLRKHCVERSHHSSVLDEKPEKPKSWSRKRKNEGRYSCESCDYMTDNITVLKNHVENQHTNPVKRTPNANVISKECEICGKLIGCESFHKHMLKHHGMKGRFLKHCDFCNKALSTIGIKMHYLQQHNYGRFACMKCKFVGSYPNELIDHMAEEHSEDHFVRCPACGKDQGFKEIEGHYQPCIREKMKKSRSWESGRKMCETCGKLIRINYYDTHTKIHLRKKIANGEENVETQGKTLYYYCDKCEMRFFRVALLNDHVRIAHDKAEFKCTLCPMSFKTRASRYGHINKVHSSDKRFECEICHKRFASEVEKRVHDSVHADAKFECKFCNKALKTQKALEVHERYHTGEKPFKCVHCGNAYVNNKALLQHKAGAHKITGVKGGLYWCKGKTKQKEQL